MAVAAAAATARMGLSAELRAELQLVKTGLESYA